MNFSDLGLTSTVSDGLLSIKFNKPTPIQQQAIPAILANKDILGIAKTGSGKTASYALPILENLQNTEKLKNRHISTLVLVPTRELALQVGDVFKDLERFYPLTIKTLAVYGGVSINPQMIAMQNVSILIATPGRLIELIESKALSLSLLKTLVMDEADKLLNQGFKDEVDKIVALLPKKRQNLLFSATLNDEISRINEIILNEPMVIKISEEEDGIELLTQSAYRISEDKKGPLLRMLIKEKNWDQVLVFTSTLKRADRVADKLQQNGIDARSIHRKKSQGERSDILSAFRRGKLPVLVSTDLLSRGIDIQYLPNVINYELPRSPKDYIHRIGRTGRADNPGEAISFISPDEEHHFRVIQKKMKKRINLIEGNDLF